MNDCTQLLLPFPSDIVEIPLSKTGKYAGLYTATISPEDADLTELNWTVRLCRENLVYVSMSRKSNGKLSMIHLHRVILERMLDRPLRADEFVDHIDRNGLNNVRSNLRLATRNQNRFNRGKAKHNTHKYKGIFQDNGSSKWRARIGVNGKTIHLGSFDTPEEAHQAYCDAAKKYHQEFANFGK